MVQLVEENSEEKPAKKKWIPSIDGRWGISLMLGGHELFIGLSISKVDASDFVKVRRRILPGKGRVVNL